MTVTRDDVTALPPSTPKPKRGKSKPLLDYSQANSKQKNSAARHFGSEPMPLKEGFDNACDLRGTRVEDAPGLLEDFLAEALGHELEVVMIRHGHGSGALRIVVREHLDRLSHVRRHRGGLSAEGGDAVTVAQLD